MQRPLIKGNLGKLPQQFLCGEPASQTLLGCENRCHFPFLLVAADRARVITVAVTLALRVTRITRKHISNGFIDRMRLGDLAQTLAGQRHTVQRALFLILLRLAAPLFRFGQRIRYFLALAV